jgi:putative selenate reductase
LFKYLTGLEKRMHKLGERELSGYILAAEGARDAGIEDVHEASIFNMQRVVERVLKDKRYTKTKNASVPRKIGSHLVLFDCISCDKCIPVCPNDANFVYYVQAAHGFSQEAYVADDGKVLQRTGLPFVVERKEQIGNYADFCNDCGNCDVFCPEDGGPYVEKPRFFGSLETYRSYAKHGGFYIEASSDLVRSWARIDGRDYRLELERGYGRARFTDGLLELVVDARSGAIEAARLAEDAAPPAGHVLSTHPARSMLAIIDGVLDATRVNPVSTQLLQPS